MSRTNIDIDDALIARVMKRYRLATKKEAVEYALRALVAPRMSRREALAMEGAGWEGDLDALRDAENRDRS
jgi:Arc/MetJ family transcription regulator